MFRNNKVFHRLPAAGQLSAPYYGANESAFVVAAAARVVLLYGITKLQFHPKYQD